MKAAPQVTPQVVAQWCHAPVTAPGAVIATGPRVAPAHAVVFIPVAHQIRTAALKAEAHNPRRISGLSCLAVWVKRR